MGKARKTKFYAVKVGRQGPRIYPTWEEAKENIHKYPGSLQKSFYSRRDAEEWLNSAPMRSAQSALGSRQNRQLLQGEPYIKQRHNTANRRTAPTVHVISSLSSVSVKKEEDYSFSEALERLHDGLASLTKSEGATSTYLAVSNPPVAGNPVTVKTEEPNVCIAPIKEAHQDNARSYSSLLKTEDVDMLSPLAEHMGVGDATNSPQVVIESPSVKLSDEQQSVLDMVTSKKSIFFTGSAGTGKSVLLREIIKRCRPDNLAITAATGIASLNIGGCTLHSWAGIGLGKESAEHLVGKFLGQDRNARLKAKAAWRDALLNRFPHDADIIESMSEQEEPTYSSTVKRWEHVQTLIIDEISMIDGVLFDKLEYIARMLRRNTAPFGGIQLVLSGDFCQLPPVPDHDGHGVPIPPTFAFDACSWARCINKHVVLRTVFRQRDQRFVDMLNCVRFGKVTPEITAEFMRLSRRITYDDGIEPTDLLPTRQEADSVNAARLRQITEPPYTNAAFDMAGFDEDLVEYPPHRVATALGRLVASKEITLKVGAHVMLLKNMIQGELVNGSRGRVVGFTTTARARASKTEIAKEDPDKNLDQKPAINIERSAEGRIWPLVKFEGGQTLLCVPATFEAVNAENLVEAKRYQIPLILAWALSIHKSQGQTLDRVRVDLRRVFEKGQAYVALSRATSLDGLEVQGFRPDKIQAHPRVIQWMREVIGEEGPPSAAVDPPKVGLENDSDDDRRYWAAFGD